MIVYSPINGEVLTDAVKFYPRTAFIMTQLGSPLPEELTTIRNGLKKELLKFNFIEVDASSFVTGKDFLDKIWKLILGAPLGIAILTKDMTEKTIANIYYELGMMDALGKESLIVKSESYEIPSDFKRTEYVNFNSSFESSFKKFQTNLDERESHYWLMGELMEADPVLAIDYIKRAYLLTPRGKYINEARRLFNINKDKIDSQSKLHIKSFLKYG